MADENKGGLLTKIFTGAVKLATVGFVAAVAWQLFLDPIFFPIFHDPTNATAQAFVSLIHESFSWIPDVIGLTGDGGLLNSQFAQNMLAPHYNALAAPTGMEMAQVFDGGLSLDDI